MTETYDIAFIRQRQQDAHAHAERIRRGVREAGFDPAMLEELPAEYIIAALVLGIK